MCMFKNMYGTNEYCTPVKERLMLLAERETYIISTNTIAYSQNGWYLPAQTEERATQCLGMGCTELFLSSRYVDIMSLFTWIGNMFAKLNLPCPCLGRRQSSSFSSYQMNGTSHFSIYPFLKVLTSYPPFNSSTCKYRNFHFRKRIIRIVTLWEYGLLQVPLRYYAHSLSQSWLSVRLNTGGRWWWDVDTNWRFVDWCV